MGTVSGIGVLDKLVAIIDAVAEQPATLKQLVARTGISRATLHRLAQGLETHGLLRRDADGIYMLGLRHIGLGRVAAEAYPLALAARPALEALQQETGESAQLYVEDQGERLCVAAVDSFHELRTIVSVGSRLPIDVGSAGRVLRGESGADGWIASVAERAPGVASVSAPVRDRGRTVAAVSVSGPIGRLGEEPGDRLGPAVAGAAGRIEAALRPASGSRKVDGTA